MSALLGSNLGSIATIIRTFRIGRALRLVQGASSMRRLFNTLLVTLPGLGNIFLLLVLGLFIYAVIGVELFATVQFNGSLDEHTNFRSFVRAVVVLLRFSTGENWNGFMYEVASGPDDTCVGSTDLPKAGDDWAWEDPGMCGFSDEGFRERPGCEELRGCGVGLGISAFYFFTFNLFVAFIFLNLFIGVILEGFDESDDTALLFSPDDFRRFKEHWQQFDPDADCLISIPQFREFLQTLYAPWGFGEEVVATDRELNQKIGENARRAFWRVVWRPALSPARVVALPALMELRARVRVILSSLACAQRTCKFTCIISRTASLCTSRTCSLACRRR